MDEEFKEQDATDVTEVDDALRVARQNHQYANYFFDAFLNAEVFVPALDAAKKAGEWRQIAQSERFFPLYLTREEDRAVPVFDTLAKLKTWAAERNFDYLVVKAHLLLKIIAPEIHVVLNEGTPFRYHFTPDVLEALRTSAKPVDPQ